MEIMKYGDFHRGFYKQQYRVHDHNCAGQWYGTEAQRLLKTDSCNDGRG